MSSVSANLARWRKLPGYNRLSKESRAEFRNELSLPMRGIVLNRDENVEVPILELRTGFGSDSRGRGGEDGRTEPFWKEEWREKLEVRGGRRGGVDVINADDDGRLEIFSFDLQICSNPEPGRGR